ncbi:nuclear transport factor 2 family protein [Candidatus Gottesmanbacteria bacterium]|nr:nuclear transport factor 2 family protein [Candidatus Gottesmanbacteria bacterium]
MKINEFEKLMQTVADGWNSYDPKKSVSCFTTDVVYMEPPDKQLVIGKDNLFKYFDNPKPMKLTWHNLMFDEDKQVGAGEFTFTMEGRQGNHGLVVVEIKDGKINFWREYYKISDLDFKDFISTKNKKFEFKLV